MGDCCNCNSEISRDGSGQLSRYLKALDPAYALVDDRSIEDLLVFTKRYASQVRFYDIPESNPGNETDKTKVSWREFFRRDMAVIAASISLTDTAQLKKDYDELRAKLDAHPSHSTFDDLFDPILGMIVKIDGWYALAIPENPLYADLQLAINSNLKWQAQKIVAYEKGFNYVDSQHPLNLDYAAIENKNIWGLNDTINADISIYNGTDTEDKILNAALYIDDIFNNFYGFISQLIANSESYIQFALHQYPAHQPHMALFIAFLQLFHLAQNQMNGITERMLDFYYRDVLHLTAKPSIPDKVHIVFELAKDVTSYYVIQGTFLKAGKDAAGKDQVYTTENDLVVNQAKVKEIKNIFIEKISSAETQADGKIITRQFLQNIYARPVANSKDGFGEKFTEPNAKWPTFGKGSAALNTSNNICDKVALLDDEDRKDQARIGFAIASPQLVLQGGKRLIKTGVNLTGLSDEQKQLLIQSLTALAQSLTEIEVWLTGEKGWLKIYATKDISNQSAFVEKSKGGVFGDDSNFESFYLLDEKDNTLCVYLPLAEQAIIAFDAKLHPGYNLETAYPVMLFVNNPLTNTNIDEQVYKQLIIPNLTIRTKVGSINPPAEINATTGAANPVLFHFDGLKKLVLQNKDGLIAPDKPFDPFTAYPLPGRSFYIGSDEIFNKTFKENNSDQLAVNIFKTLDEEESTPAGTSLSAIQVNNRFLERYNVSILENRQWSIIKDDKKLAEVFKREDLTANILNKTVLPVNRAPVNAVTEWKSETEKGFIKIDLKLREKDGNEGTGLFFLAATQNISILQQSQNLAPGLEIKEISVSYDSTLDSLQMGVDQFFHIYPFGVVETYLHSPALSGFIGSKGSALTAVPDFSTLDDLKKGLLVYAGNILLPQFNFSSPYSKYYNSIDLSARTSIRNSKELFLGNSLRGAYNPVRDNRNTAVRLMLDARNTAVNSANQYIGIMQQGMLFIGIEKLQPLQSISMLFQFAEGSAEDEDDDPPSINWSYLTYNEWRPLKAENIVSDGTYGFQTTGIIKIDMPADALAHNTIITDGLTWLCASVTENANRIPQLIDIVTQAVEAEFKDNGNDPSHFDTALPAASISKLSTPVAQISKVQQPFASFDGKHQEIGKEFYTRVSERLRHKARAINAWDYEHLVLDRFPSVYKVKCITHTDPNCLCTNKSLTVVNSVLPTTLLFNGDNTTIQNTLNVVAGEVNKNPFINITLVGHGLHAVDNIKKVIDAYATGVLQPSGAVTKIDLNRINSKVVADGDDTAVDIIETENCCGPQIAPGHVLLIPIANLKNRNAANPLQPKTSRRTLIAIQEYLKTRTSPFVHVHAKNPVYEQIIVSFKVQFYSGIDKGYYMKKLNDEIVHFLTPWAFDENAEITFNQKIYASSIINFIEERTYVDFITDFIMGVCCNECCTPLETAGIGVISGTVRDNENMQNALEGITIKIKEINKLVKTVANGTYKIENIPPGAYTLLAYFSMFNIAKQSFTIDDTGAAVPATIDFYEGAGNRQDDIEEFFTHFCGCDAVEKFLQYDPNFDGDIVAKPCTSRSILVSVPQHIIIPYEEGEEPTPCEKRKAALATDTTANSIVTGVNPGDSLTLAPVRIIKSSVNKLIANKKADKVSPAKSATADNIKKIKAGTIKQAPKPKKPR